MLPVYLCGVSSSTGLGTVKLLPWLGCTWHRCLAALQDRLTLWHRPACFATCQGQVELLAIVQAHWLALRWLLWHSRPARCSCPHLQDAGRPVRAADLNPSIHNPWMRLIQSLHLLVPASCCKGSCWAEPTSSWVGRLPVCTVSF